MRSKRFPTPLLPGVRRRASTLVLSLWALLLLSAAILAWAKWIDGRMDLAHQANLALEARALALSGVTVAMHPDITPLTPALREEREGGRGYEAMIWGEGGRLNLAYLLLGEVPERMAILQAYLELRGLTLEEQQTLLDGLLDWVDADNVRRLHGKEEDASYKPPNKMITSLDEIPLIHGSAPLLEKYPQWRDDFTLLSRGPLDLQFASEELIGLIPGIGEHQARTFVQARQGGDGEDQTEDDPEFENLEAVMLALSLNQEQFQAISSLVSFGDPTVRIISTGKAGEVHRQLEVVTRKMDGRTPVILLWIEK